MNNVVAVSRRHSGSNNSSDKLQPSAPVGFVRWMKFNLVGGIGIGVQLATLAVLTHVFRWNYLLATALAVEAAVVHNFLWHERFTWADRSSPNFGQRLARLSRFNMTTGAVSIVGNLAFMHLLVSSIGMPPLAANLTSIAMCSLLNFVVNDRVVFRKTSTQHSALSSQPDLVDIGRTGHCQYSSEVLVIPSGARDLL